MRNDCNLASIRSQAEVAMVVRLWSGREIELRELRQVLVYESILEGVPTQDDTRRLVGGLLAEMTSQFQVRPLLIEPVERILDRPPTRRGIPAKIPAVGCIGRFVSFQPARDPSQHASELLVLWFQEDFGLADAPALERLKLVDWEGSARDFEW